MSSIGSGTNESGSIRLAVEKAQPVPGIDYCANALDKPAFVNPATGRLVEPRCRTNACTFCCKIKAEQTLGAMVLAVPVAIGVFTLIEPGGDPMQTARGRSTSAGRRRNRFKGQALQGHREDPVVKEEAMPEYEIVLTLRIRADDESKARMDAIEVAKSLEKEMVGWAGEPAMLRVGLPQSLMDEFELGFDDWGGYVFESEDSALDEVERRCFSGALG